ncbi:exonuclease 1 [Clonorchis sinensis]|uniref:Exonuclease 1 n=1 Tax=Clonorchis sinensis TaxID=79923 RepID=H2KSI3_CLOSI|nr:exonuclease 1 [Clonorchis sinensis]
MGISGLLPFLKKASCPVNIKEFNGYTVAVDAYCWLHKSSYACAMDLALGNPTDQYVRYTLKYLEMLLTCNIKPILVFDGASLPSKADTELKRKESKESYRKKAAEYLLQGNREAAQECFQRSVFVTSKMAHDVLKAARNLGVDCIVAPYEADAQLAYLNRAGYADLVITEDSDLLLFGCRQVIFKLDLTGAGVLVAVTAGIGELCCGMRPNQFTDSTLRYMGILSGCDYFSGIPGIGLATAAKILRQTRLSDFRELLSKLGLYTNLSPAALAASVPTASLAEKQTIASSRSGGTATKRLQSSLIDAAVRAERTFRLQVVFDPLTRTQRRLTEPTQEDMADEVRMLSGEDANTLVNKENLFTFAGEITHLNQQRKEEDVLVRNLVHCLLIHRCLSCGCLIKNNDDDGDNDIVGSADLPRLFGLSHYRGINPDNSKAFQLALGNLDFHDDTVWDTFDPDTPSSTTHHSLQKPRSEGSLLSHFSRPIVPDNNDSPSSVRPVLGQLGPNGHTAVGALKRPSKDRLRTSIWDRNFSTQKETMFVYCWMCRIERDNFEHEHQLISLNPDCLPTNDTFRVWIHRRLNDGDNKPSVHCLTVSTVSPLKELPTVRNAETIDTQWSEDFDNSTTTSSRARNTRMMPPTLGKQLFVSTTILNNLNRAIKRTSDSSSQPSVPKRSTIVSSTSPVYMQEVDSTSEILQTYRASLERTATPAPQLPDRSMLCSTVLSCSNYFPPKRLQLSSSILDSPAAKEDDIACALQTAVDSDKPDRVDAAPRSPVFHRNPFGLNAQLVRCDTGTSSADTVLLTPPSQENVQPPPPSSFSPSTSPSSASRTTPGSRFSPTYQSPTFSSRLPTRIVLNTSPVFASDLTKSSTPPPPPSSPSPDDDSAESSPNFLNSHLSQPIVSSRQNTRTSPMFHGKSALDCPGSLSVSSSIERFKYSPVNVANPVRTHSTSIPSSGKRPPSKAAPNRSSANLPRPIAGANRTLNYYFRQWQFKDTDN